MAAEPDIQSSRTVYEGFFHVRVDHLKLPHGPELFYTHLKTGCDAVAILAETDDDSWIVLKEYRHPAGQWLLGCAGGRLEPGETPIQGGARELLEETGFASNEYHVLGEVYPFPAVCDQKIYFVLAKSAKQVQPTQHEAFELIQVEQFSKQELYRLIRSGTPTDGILCTALFLSQIHFDNSFSL